MSDVLAIGDWKTNSDMIADVARLGYLDGRVLDATYGLHGGFWKAWAPDELVANDLHHPADHHYSYREFPIRWESTFDSVVFDPPYKLNGTPALGDQDERFGTTRRTTREEVLEDLRLGAIECYRVAKRFLLVKCQDQVEGGKVRWQTDLVTEAVSGVGGEKIDRFDFKYEIRPQPGDRTQRTARRNYSTLLVFRKKDPRPRPRAEPML